MHNFIRNTFQLVKEPRMLPLYFKWFFAKKICLRSPNLLFSKDIRVSNFTSFGDFWKLHFGIPEIEIFLLEKCFRVLPNEYKSVAVDIGANFGFFSLYLAKIGFEKVYAFEPIPITFDLFKGNLDINPAYSSNIIPVNLGISDQEGLMNFSENPASLAQSKIVNESHDVDLGYKIHSVKVKTLDGFFKDNRNVKIGFLKIDIEGFEVAALRGSRALLQSKSIAFIYLEVIPKALEEAGDNVEDLEKLLDFHGFMPVIPIANNSFSHENSISQVFQRCSFEAAINWAGNRRNILFVRNDLLNLN